MALAVFSIAPHTLDIGLCGAAEPQKRLRLPHDLGDRVLLRRLLTDAVRALLCAASSLKVVIVEPPLCVLATKQALAEILLNELGVRAVGFLQRSVCCLAGTGRSGGILVDDAEQLVVPVYDFRELSPMIRGNSNGVGGEQAAAQIMEEVVAAAPIDIRKQLRAGVVAFDELLTFLGASVLARNRRVWPMLSRDVLRRRSVWDSLYDMK